MAGIAEIEAKRRALVAESEAYRQALKLEVENLRLYTARTRQRFNLLSAAKPLLYVLPIAGVFFRKKAPEKPHKKPQGWRRWLGLAMTGWRVYRSASPVFASVTSLSSKRRAARRARFGAD